MIAFEAPWGTFHQKHGPQARDDALLGGELLAHDIGFAAMPAEALAQPVLQAVQPLRALRLL